MHVTIFGPRLASMGPKQRAVSELGVVVEHGNGWRAKAQLGRGLVVTGPTHFGRAARRKAEADLVHARRASTRGEMQRVLQNLKDGSEPKAASFAEPLPQPGQTHPCGGPRPESDGDIGASHSAAGARADKHFVSSSGSAPNAVEQPAAVALTEELAAESPDEKQGETPRVSCQL